MTRLTGLALCASILVAISVATVAATDETPSAQQATQDIKPLLPGETGLLKPSDKKLVAVGKRIYADNCASCHGKNLEGAPNWRRPKADGKLPAPPHDISGHTWHHADQVLFDLTKYGLKKFAGNNYQTDMPVYNGVLSDEEIVAVLSFIKSTWPENIRAYHDELNATAAQNQD